MENYYKESICLVTGASSGIGASLSRMLIEKGAKVVIGADVNESDYRNEKFVFKKLDVTDNNKFKEIIDGIVKDYGRIDFIFNNAGIAITGEAHDIPLAEWKKIIDVDLYGVIYGTLHAYNHMIKQGSGHIVNISSVAGFFPIPLEAPYVVSKFGVLGLSLVMRVEGALKGVKISAVCPGLIKTPILKSPGVNIDMDKYTELFSKVLGEATPDECAEVILEGVSKNKPIITVTEPAKWMWYLARINPDEMLETMTNEYQKVLPIIKKDKKEI